MSKETTSSDDMYDTLGRAFGHAQELNEVLDLPSLEKGQKISVRNKLNKFEAMIREVLEFEDDVTKDVVDGMTLTAEMVKAKLEGRELPEIMETDYNTAA